MNTHINITDDPRLTAYALGVLKGAERDEIERLIAGSSAAKAEVEAIRQMAGALTYELAGKLPRGETETAARVARSEHGCDGRGSDAGTSQQSRSWQAGVHKAPHRSQLKRRLTLAALATTVAVIAVTLGVLSQRDFTSSKRQAQANNEALTQAAESEQTPAPASAAEANVGTQQQLAGLVQQFNLLIDGKRFDEADSLAVHAEQLAPGTRVGAQMRWMSQLRRSLEIGGDIRNQMADGFVTALAPIGEASKACVDQSDKICGGAPVNGQPAAACCAPCSTSPAPAIGGSPSPGANRSGVCYTICKPVYGTTGSTSSLCSLGMKRQTTTGAVASLSHVADRNHLTTAENAEFDFETAPRVGQGNESYAPIVENVFLSPLKEPLSTFSADVDTASYANVRRFLEQGQLPPPDAVRIEEMLNYFSYDYAPPADGKPFAVHVETAACPWNTKHRLARIAIKGREVPRDKRPPSNLVFLVDVSGSMDEPNKLPLVKASLAMIVESLNENDRVALVTYADGVQCVLDSTPGNKRAEIMAAITHLAASGATNGEGGIQMAYKTAAKGFRQGGTNRIILCTDGDFNVGVSDDGELVKLIEEKRKSGVFLSIFGFGMGNLKDAKLEKLADHGNGQYGYIDSRQEARKVFVEGLSGTLVTIAKDVKLQVEFNPAQVGAYRLIGYEKRALAAEDFNNDAKDAGDIGAGHNVTALYEIVPASEMKAGVDSLKYQGQPAKAEAKAASDELFTLKLRYKQPDGDTGQKIEIPCKDRLDASAHPSRDFDWAAGVAAFGMLLRDSKHKGIATFDLALELAQGGKGADTHGYRSECIELMRKAKGLKDAQKGAVPPPAPPMPVSSAAPGGPVPAIERVETAPPALMPRVRRGPRR